MTGAQQLLGGVLVEDHRLGGRCAPRRALEHPARLGTAARVDQRVCELDAERVRVAEVERALVQRHRAIERERGRRFLGGGHREVRRLDDIAGRTPVRHQRFGVGMARALERDRDPAVQRGGAGDVREHRHAYAAVIRRHGVGRAHAAGAHEVREPEMRDLLRELAERHPGRVRRRLLQQLAVGQTHEPEQVRRRRVELADSLPQRILESYRHRPRRGASRTRGARARG